MRLLGNIIWDSEDKKDEIGFTEFRRGAAEALEICRREKPNLVILQPRSPSCGVGSVYDGTFGGKLVPGNGIFAALAAENGFRVESAEEILKKGRLEV